MNDRPDESSQIRETDIVFDCPFCGKSLAIDYRGAGLNVPCTDCGRNVQVPIPEGMEIADIDSTREEQEIRILNLRRALTAAEARIHELEADLEAMRKRRSSLEGARVEDRDRLGIARDAMEVIRSAHDEIMKGLDAIAQATSEIEEKEPPK